MNRVSSIHTYHDDDNPVLLTCEEDFHDLWRHYDPNFGNSNMPLYYPCLMTYSFRSNPNGADYFETYYIYPDQAFKLFFEEAYQKALAKLGGGI